MTDSLDEARGLAREGVRRALDRLDADDRKVCGYHLGFWDAAGIDTSTPDSAGGKQIRAMLALLSAQAAGAPARDGIPAAVACELVHNFSLLHDDIMDGDTERRHQPTAWSVYGSASAILAGDAMLSLACEVLAESPSRTAAWAVRCLSAATRRLIAGQTADLAFEERRDVTPKECLAMERDKTGALLACSASLGAVLVDAPASMAVGLAEFGDHLGAAFQAVDDLLGIWGRPERTGKPVLSDLRARKKSLPVVAALASETDAGRRLGELYFRREPLDEPLLREAATLVEHAGGRDFAERTADDERAAALAALDGLALPEEVHDRLRDLTDQLATRDH
ncbi:polyprenyl synthetase family protein [Segeticoccus sp.]|uniref:polyprenyl synthetase family protein n=1 Tax=Segeticoccus sp. TaxID=2706531 RepID=UPI002D7E163E|nr:polyprenyl synthetase family protein [Segeticoccus sp.]